MEPNDAELHTFLFADLAGFTALTDAPTVSAPEAPCVSSEFGTALRSFCEEVLERTTATRQTGGDSR